jgi:hypothetical protein
MPFWLNKLKVITIWVVSQFQLPPSSSLLIVLGFATQMLERLSPISYTTHFFLKQVSLSPSITSLYLTNPSKWTTDSRSQNAVDFTLVELTCPRKLVQRKCAFSLLRWPVQPSGSVIL